MRLYVIVFSALLLGASKGADKNNNAADGKDFVTPFVISGTKCSRVKEGFFLIYDDKSKKELVDAFLNDDWGKGNHTGANITAIQVDFAKYIVVAIYQGSSSNNDGLTITDVFRKDETVHLRYHPSWYQTDAENVRLTASYAIVLLPRSENTILIEEDTQMANGQPPIWTLRAKLNERIPKK